MAVYRKCLPSGRKNGQRWEVCSAGSIFVIGVGVPPVALTRKRGAAGVGEKIITPSAPHAPPRDSDASATTCAEPPLRSIVFSLASAKKPSERLSGDQKGNIAPFVSGISRASSAFMARTQSEVLPSAPVAVNAIDVPSGESTGGPAASPVRFSVLFSGGLITVRRTRVDWGAR